MSRKKEIFKLVSGLKVEFQQMMVADENVIARGKKARRDRANLVLNEVLSRCTVGVVEPGPYTSFEVGGPVDWGRVLTGDRLDAMLALRRLSYKDGNKILVPELSCSCGNEFSWEVDIETDLRYQPLPPESIERLMSGDPFVCEMDDGHKIHFILATGDTEVQIDKIGMQYPDREMATGLRARIIDVIKPDGEKVDRREIMDWLDGGSERSTTFDGLSSDEAEVFRDEMDRVDGGVDLEVTAICPSIGCGRGVKFDLPFETIFVPSRGIQKRKMARRHGKGY